MFEVDHDRQFLSIRPEAVVALYHTVNQVQVALPGKSPAQARAVVAGYRLDSGSFRVDVALHLPDSGEHVLYSPGPQALDAASAREVAEEALGFLESMGFFLEKIEWRQLGPVEQRELLAKLKVFLPPLELSKPVSSSRVVDPRTLLARVLAQI